VVALPLVAARFPTGDLGDPIRVPVDMGDGKGAGEVAILAHGGLAMSAYDAEGRFVDVNEAWVRLFGWTREEALAMSIADVSAEPDATRSAVRAAAERGGMRIPVRWHRRKDGSTFAAEHASAVLRSGAHTILYSIITELEDDRRVELARRASEASFRALIESMPDGVVVHRNGRVLYLNPRARALLGYDALDEIAGKDALELIHPDDRPVVIERVREMIRDGVTVPPLEERFLRKDGSSVAVEVAAMPTEFGGEPAILAIVRDLSARKAMEASLVTADRLASLGRLAAAIAHEINNPLAYVMGNLEVLARELRRAGDAIPDDLRAAFAHRIAVAEDGAARVRDIVRDVKTLSLVEGASEPVDLHRVLDVCGAMAEHELRHRARLVKHYGAPARVLASEARLGQVFLNLLVNAAQAIPEGNVDANEIEVRTRRSGPDEVVVEVHDTGSGIPASIVDRIFEPFFTTKSRGKGSGLGLAISRDVVASLGGTISVEPRTPRGTTFRVVLPTSERLPSSAPTPAPRPVAPTLPRVLIIDDEPRLARVLEAQLDGDYEVTIAHSGRQAIEILGRFSDFAAIVCDVLMPDLTGIDVHEWLRERHPGLERRVVFMTGGALSARARTVLDAAQGRCLAKPFTGEELRRALERARSS
jgi:PAS domain S-box-containing protein